MKECEKFCNDLKATCENLRLDLRKMRNSLIRWQIAIAAIQILLLAKGFGWLGF